ncbi:hypothetical protein BH10CHL1_BH10CHL1_48740 [soil metagenome]
MIRYFHKAVPLNIEAQLLKERERGLFIFKAVFEYIDAREPFGLCVSRLDQIKCFLWKLYVDVRRKTIDAGKARRWCIDDQLTLHHGCATLRLAVNGIPSMGINFHSSASIMQDYCR